MCLCFENQMHQISGKSLLQLSLMQAEIRQSTTSEPLRIAPTAQQAQIINQFLNQRIERLIYMIFAPPGTGKTTLSRELIFQLMHKKKVPPNKILFLTFARNLTEDSKQHLRQNNPQGFAMQPPSAMTLSSLGRKILNQMDVNVIKVNKYENFDESNAKNLMKKVIAKNRATVMEQIGATVKDLYGTDFNNEKKQLDALMRRVFSKVTLIHANNKTHSQYQQQLGNKKPLTKRQIFDLKMLELYQKEIQQKMESEQKLTFDHMTYEAIKKIRRVANPEIQLPAECMAEYIIVDQFQDLNKAQIDMIQALIQKKKQRKFLFLGDPDQNIYGWRYANYKNIQNLEQKLKNDHNFTIKKRSLTKSMRLHQKMADLAYDFITTDDAKIDYTQIRNRIFKEVPNYGKLVAQPKDQEIIIEEYQEQFDEINKIIERIYYKMQKGQELRKMTILVRSIKYAGGFIKKLQFGAKEFEQNLKDKGIQVKIPLLVLTNRNIFNDKNVNFITSCLEYYYFIEEKNPEKDQKQKISIIKKILTSIDGISTSDGYVKKVTVPEQLSLDLILKDQNKLMLQEFYRNHRTTSQHKKWQIYSSFRQKFNQFLELCRDKDSSFGQIVQYLINTFYNNSLMILDKNENVQNFAEFISNFGSSEEGGKKNWKIFITNLHANDQTDPQKLPNKVVIQTLHKAKGRTYETVFLPAMNGNFQWMGDDQQDLAVQDDYRSQKAKKNEELRLYYTGITRTKGSLYVTRSIQFDKFNRQIEVKRQFLYLKKLIFAYDEVKKTPAGEQMRKSWGQSEKEKERLQQLKKDKKEARKKGKNRERPSSANQQLQQQTQNNSKRFRQTFTPKEYPNKSSCTNINHRMTDEKNQHQEKKQKNRTHQMIQQKELDEDQMKITKLIQEQVEKQKNSAKKQHQVKVMANQSKSLTISKIFEFKKKQQQSQNTRQENTQKKIQDKK